MKHILCGSAFSFVLIVIVTTCATAQNTCLEPIMTVPDTLRKSKEPWVILKKNESCESKVSYTIKKVTYMVFKGIETFEVVSATDATVPVEISRYLDTPGLKVAIIVNEAERVEYGISEPLYLDSSFKAIRTIY